MLFRMRGVPWEMPLSSVQSCRQRYRARESVSKAWSKQCDAFFARIDTPGENALARLGKIQFILRGFLRFSCSPEFWRAARAHRNFPWSAATCFPSSMCRWRAAQVVPGRYGRDLNIESGIVCRWASKGHSRNVLERHARNQREGSYLAGLDRGPNQTHGVEVAGH